MNHAHGQSLLAAGMAPTEAPIQVKGHPGQVAHVLQQGKKGEEDGHGRQHHRHHKPVAGHKFSIGCAENGRLCAVAIVGRPVSRYLDDGFTLEVNRLCSDGTKNACSILYAAAARAARAMGYRKIITYTLDTESGASLRAAGWTNAGLAGGKAWTGSRRPAQPLYPAQMKYRYEKRLNERSC